MNKLISRNIIRAIFLLAIQLLLLRRINLTFGDFNYIHLSIYPLIIALFPHKMSRPLVILVAFFIGLSVDVFYNSLGVHAGTCVLVAFLRHYILMLISPTDGYKGDSLTSYKYGIAWSLTYLSMFLLIHQLTLYSLEAFSPVYIKEIVLRTIFSFIASLFLIMIGQLIFNPKY